MFLTHVRNLVTFESDGTFDPFRTFSTFQSAESPESRPGRKPDVGVGIASFGLVVPSMAQAWYTGPIAKVTGDIGFEVAFVLTSMLYIPFRALEIKIRRSL